MLKILSYFQTIRYCNEVHFIYLSFKQILAMSNFFKVSIAILSFLCIQMAFGQNNTEKLADTTFVNLADYSADFIYDMRYATDNNFLKVTVYDCAECYLRLKTVQGLLAASELAKQKGMKIKIFDCYRPLDIQKKMFAIVPNPTFVANPATGSIHNRGGAVDISLVDCDGNELEMGTEFDHFGPEAAHQYKNMPRKVINNRKKLRKIMEASGFTTIASEWWHYNFMGSKKDNVSNFKWTCK